MLATAPVPSLVEEAHGAAEVARVRLRLTIRARLEAPLRDLSFLDHPHAAPRDWVAAALGLCTLDGDATSAGTILAALYHWEDARQALAVAEAAADARVLIVPWGAR